MADWSVGDAGTSGVDLQNVKKMKVQGGSKAVEDREKNGLVYLNRFLGELAEKNKTAQKTWETMSEAEICVVELFQAFCEWMKNRPTSGSTSEPLAINTAQEYFSGAVTFFKNTRYPENAIWHGTGGITNQSPYWYSTLRQQLATQAIREAQKRGEKIVSKSDELGRTGLSKVIEWTLKRGSEQGGSIFIAATTALMMALNFASVGRSSGCQTASFDSMRWSDGKQCMVMVWPDIKTGTPQEMPYYNDYSEKFLDVYFLLALYIIAGCPENQRGERHGQDDVDFVFPKYATSGTSLSSLLTTAMRNAMEQLPEYAARKSSYDGTSIRFVYYLRICPSPLTDCLLTTPVT